MDQSTQQQPAIGRIAWIDTAKGVCILLVILLHSVSYYRAIKIGQPPDAMADVVDFLSPVRMPTLVLLSGVMAPFGMRKGRKGFLAGRARILLWPYLIWCVIWAFASGDAAKLLTAKWWLGGWYLWFLLFILLYSLVAAIVPARLHLVLAGYAYVASLLMDDGTKYGERLFFFMSLFLVGSFLGQHFKRTEAALASPITLLLSPAALGVLIYSAMDGPVRYSPHDYGIIGIVVTTVLALCWRAADARHWPVITHLGRNSLTIYLVHMPVIAVILRGLRAIGFNSFYPSFLAAFLLSIAASLAAIRLRRRWRAIDALFAFPILKRRATPAPAPVPSEAEAVQVP